MSLHRGCGAVWHFELYRLQYAAVLLERLADNVAERVAQRKEERHFIAELPDKIVKDAVAGHPPEIIMEHPVDRRDEDVVVHLHRLFLVPYKMLEALHVFGSGAQSSLLNRSDLDELSRFERVDQFAFGYLRYAKRPVPALYKVALGRQLRERLS